MGRISRTADKSFSSSEPNQKCLLHFENHYIYTMFLRRTKQKHIYFPLVGVEFQARKGVRRTGKLEPSLRFMVAI